MPLFNAIISISCGIMWLVRGLENGFTPFGIIVTVLWFFAALLFSVAYFKRRKIEEK